MRIHEFLRAQGKGFLRAAGALLCFWMAFNSPIASANFTYFAADCATGVTFTYAQFPLTPIPSHEIIKVDGVVVYDGTYTVNKTVPGSTITHTVPFSPKPSPGPHTVVASTNYTTDGFNKTTTSSPLAINCVCTPGTDNPAGAHARGDAYGLYARLPVLGTVTTRAQSASSQSGIGGTERYANQASVSLPPATGAVVKLGLLNTANTSAVGTTPSEADQTGFSEVANVNLLGGVIKATVVRASVEAIARGDSAAVSTAGSTFEGLTIAGTSYSDTPPNTRVDLPVVPGVLDSGSYVILNERITTTSVPAPGVLSGGTYSADVTVNMIHVYVKLLGLTSEVIVSHASAHADFPQTSICSAAARNSVSGHAFVASSNLISPVGFPVLVGYSGIPASGGAASQSVTDVNIPGFASPAVSGSTASSSSTGTVGGTSSNSTSSAAIQNANLLNGVVKATVIQTTSNSTASSGSRSSDAVGTQLVNISVAGLPIANNPAPNTTLTIPGVGYVIFNEQFPDVTSGGHTGLTIRAIRLVTSLPGSLPGLEVIVAESHSDATFN